MKKKISIRTNKFTPRIFIRKEIMKDIENTIKNIKDKMLSDGIVSKDTTLWNDFDELLVDELSDFQMKVKLFTIKNY